MENGAEEDDQREIVALSVPTTDNKVVASTPQTIDTINARRCVKRSLWLDRVKGFTFDM